MNYPNLLEAVVPLFGVGWFELVIIGIIAVFVFGPERLPRMIVQLTGMIRSFRTQAMSARNDLMAAADLDPELTGQLRQTVTDLAELNPRRMAGSIFTDVVAPLTEAAQDLKSVASTPRGSITPVPTPAPTAPPTPATPPAASSAPADPNADIT